MKVSFLLPVLLLKINFFLGCPTVYTRGLRRWRQIWLLVGAILANSPTARAQITAVIDPTASKPGGVEGFVMHALTGKAIEGAIIRVAGTTASSSTAADGMFRLRNVFPGTRTLTIMAESMRAVYVADVAVHPGRTVRLRPVDLRPAPVNGVEELETLVVNASQLATDEDFGTALVPLARMVVVPSHYAAIEDPVAYGSSLSQADLEALPQSNLNLYRSTSQFPGLAGNDTGTRFWVRGAPNDQVLTRFDGVDLLEPFHAKGYDGALSVVDLETVNRLDLITGGFTAKYGNRMAGVLTMETESFEPAESRNTLGISLTDIRGINRGEFNGGRGSWLVEGRFGNPSWVAADNGDDEGDLTTTYADFNAKIEYRLTPEQGVSLHVLHTSDRLRFQDPLTPYLKSDYDSNYVWGRWRGRIGDRLYGETVLSLAYLSWHHRTTGPSGNQHVVAINDYRELTQATLRQDWTLVLSERALVQSGFEYTIGQGSYDYSLLRNQTFTAATGNTTFSSQVDRIKKYESEGKTVGVFVAPRVRVTSRLTIEPSLRFDHQDYTEDKVVSPRFNASYSMGRTILRAAWGIYYQGQGLHQRGVATEDDLFHPAEKAEHRVFSVERRFVRGIQLRAEVYERRLSRIRPHWDTLANIDGFFPGLRYDQRLQQPSDGLSRGLELIAENRSPGKLNWAVSYALAKSQETIENRKSPSPRDQRHTFALDASYAPDPKWRLSASWQYHTGWPATQVEFFAVTFDTRTVLFGDLQSLQAERLPAYHRLDLRATRIVYLNKSTLRLFVELANAYDRKNIQGYEYLPVIQSNGNIGTERRAQRQISFTPNIGAVWEF